jgi:hypothetical protein
MNVIEAMKAKDPELFAQVEHMIPGQAYLSWKAAYPEDFPEGVKTDMQDGGAIKPHPLTYRPKQPNLSA